MTKEDAAKKGAIAFDQNKKLRDQLAKVLDSKEEVDIILKRLYDVSAKTSVEIEKIVSMYVANIGILKAKKAKYNIFDQVRFIQGSFDTFNIDNLTESQIGMSKEAIFKFLQDGKMNTEGLKVILSTNKEFAESIKKYLNVDDLQFQNMVGSGEITYEKIVNAIVDDIDNLNEKAKKSVSSMNDNINKSKAIVGKVANEIGSNAVVDTVIDSVNSVSSVLIDHVSDYVDDVIDDLKNPDSFFSLLKPGFAYSLEGITMHGIINTVNKIKGKKLATTDTVQKKDVNVFQEVKKNKKKLRQQEEERRILEKKIKKENNFLEIDFWTFNEGSYTVPEKLSKEEVFEALKNHKRKDIQIQLISPNKALEMSFPKPQIEDELSQVDQINEIGLQIQLVPTIELPKMSPIKSQAQEAFKKAVDENHKNEEQAKEAVGEICVAKKEFEVQLVPTIEPPKMSLVKSQAQEAAQEVVDKNHKNEEKAKEAVGEVCVAKKEIEVQLVPTAPKMSLVNPQIEEAVNETLDEVQEKIVPVEIELEVNEQELNSLNSNIKKRLEKPKQAVNLQKNQISSRPKAYVANASFAKANPKNKPDVEPKNQVLDAAYLQEDIKKFAEANSNLQKSFENTLPQSSADQVSRYNEEIIQATNSISDLIMEQQGLMEIADEALLQTKELGDANQAYWENWIENMENKLTNFNDMIASGINNFMNGFSNALFEIVRGTQSVSDAFRNMLSGLVENTVRAITQMVAQYLTLAAVKAIAGIPPGVPTSAQAGGGIFGSYLNAAPLIGMSHAGFDEIPKTGTWLLEKGERVTTAQTSAKLDRVLDEVITSNYYNSRNTSVTNQINVRGNVDNRTASQIALETDRRLKRADRRFGNG